MFPLKLSINWVYNKLTFPVSFQYCAVFRFCLLCLFTVFSHCELYCISIMCKFAVLCCYWNNKLDLRPPTQQQWQCFFHLGHVDFILYTTSHIYAFDVTPRLWIVWRIYSQLNQSKSHLNHLNCDIAVIRNKLLPYFFVDHHVYSNILRIPEWITTESSVTCTYEMRRKPQAYEALTVSYDQLTKTWDSVCNRTWTAGDKPSRVACRIVGVL